jgi:predicted Zn-dependent protease
MMDEAKARGLVERILGLVRAAKAEGAVSLRESRAGNTRFAVGEITSSADVDRVTVSVTAQFGKRSATATANQIDDTALADVVERAARMARLAPENPEDMPPLGRQKYLAIKGAVDSATAAMTPPGRAKSVGSALDNAAKLQLAGYYSHAQAAHALGTTAGLSAYHAWTTCGLSCTARTSDGTGSGWAGGASNKVGDVDAGALAKIAADKAVKSQKPKKLEPGRYTVVLEPSAVASMLGFLTGSLDARRADEGRSFFAKRGVGTKLFPETITLRSDPTDAGLAASPFDGEGFALAPTKWIDKGAVAALVYSRYWASKQGKPATGGPNGWVLDGGKASASPGSAGARSDAQRRADEIDELIKGVKRGVLITRMWYLRWLEPQTMLVTGLTRDGTFLIEDGAITAPVNNFRFNESPIQMLGKADGLTASAITVEGMRVPALRTHEFNLASISEAV